MEELIRKIREEGTAIGEDIVKVDCFLNHQLDVGFLRSVGQEFASRFEGCRIDRILTVEASGIAIAVASAQFMGDPPVVFAKKAAPSTMKEGFLTAQARSFTKGTISNLIVSQEYLKSDESVLILDDFLASAEAAIALAQLVEKAGGQVVGIGAVIEKGFQGGSEKLREMGYRVESLAVINRIKDGRIYFEGEE